MNKVTFIDVEHWENGLEIFAIIDHGNEEYTSMPKALYDEQQAALSTPSV